MDVGRASAVAHWGVGKDRSSRRPVLQGGVALAAFSLLPCHDAAGQHTGTVLRIGCLAVGSREGRAFLIEGFRQGLREQGYVEGQHIVIQYRFSTEPFLLVDGVLQREDGVTSVLARRVRPLREAPEGPGACGDRLTPRGGPPSHDFH